ATKGEQVAKSPVSRVLRVTADGKRYYVKRYLGNGKNAVRRWFGLRGLVAPQRVVKEWKNLLLFRKWGIPTATLVGYGLEHLERLATASDPCLRDRRWMAQVLRQVANITRTLHAAGFAHNDLKWRNLLVDGGGSPTVYLIDCPSGGMWWGVFLKYRIIKDLACLDKVAKYQLSRSQRLRFYLDYTGQRRLGVEDKQRIRKILAFFEGRE
ncbi:lipopolysaccharide kinase InaA family protein, partial [Candidatus Propionivibrio aalborgensis]|uniref:lipopolysaccharide kinase InaA family protein n=1 Tax=Candidatus Propionivibrio aalborgensis TaxID=1860101 RepID=UPI000A73C2C3